MVVVVLVCIPTQEHGNEIMLGNSFQECALAGVA